MTDALVSLMTGLGPVALVILMLVAFAETGLLIGFLIPGDTVVFTAGVLMAAGAIDAPVWLALVGVVLAAAAGDQTAYFVGQHFGPRVLNRPDSRLLSPRHIGAAQRFFERHGSKAVVLARFVPVARTMTPVVAGVGTMSRRRFTSYNLAGATAWTLVTLGGGYLFGGIPFVADHVGEITLGVAALSTLPLVVAAVRRRLSRRRSTDRTATPQTTGVQTTGTHADGTQTTGTVTQKTGRSAGEPAPATVAARTGDPTATPTDAPALDAPARGRRTCPVG